MSEFLPNDNISRDSSCIYLQFWRLSLKEVDITLIERKNSSSTHRNAATFDAQRKFQQPHLDG